MIRVFVKRTTFTPIDDLAFVGNPPLFRPDDRNIPVAVSCVFSWDRPEALRLRDEWATYYNDVSVGGPAFDDPGGEFIPGRFVKHGVTITSRGCIKRCKWCFVPKREGTIRELEIKRGNVVQDNNLLACSRKHIEAVFDMLQDEKGVYFSGGFDSTLFEDWHRNLLDTIRVREIWWACDTDAAIPVIAKVAKMCDGISRNKMRCYTMIGFNGETIAQAKERCERVYNLGYLPFAQLYKGDGQQEYGEEWKALARFWSRPAIYKSEQVKKRTWGKND